MTSTVSSPPEAHRRRSAGPVIEADPLGRVYPLRNTIGVDPAAQPPVPFFDRLAPGTPLVQLNAHLLADRSTTARPLARTARRSQMRAHRFMFATGIENSYPTIENGRVRIDELETGGHYKHWETDFALLRDLDIGYLRYGPPIHRTWLAHERYDWSFADLSFGRLKSLDIVPIVDLCHFGVPDWIGNFQVIAHPLFCGLRAGW
jgi:hypothetical protein